jgi:hypothetical protein
MTPTEPPTMSPSTTRMMPSTTITPESESVARCLGLLESDTYAATFLPAATITRDGAFLRT